MTKKRKIIISIIITVAIAIAFVLILWKYSPEQQRKSMMRRGAKIMQQEWQNALTVVKTSKFTISGKIVDDAGNPVNNVRVSISQSYPKKQFTESDSVRSTRIVSSNFKIELFGGAGVSLHFSKKGYYSVKNKCYSLPKSKGLSFFSTNTLKVDNQKIIMEREGKLARCKRYSTSFFIRKEKFFTSFFIPNLGKDSKNRLFDQVKYLLNGTIYPDVERDKNGEIIKVKINISGRMGPRTTYLNMVGAEGDGFILFKGQPHRGIIGIKEAPVSGYVNQMVFHWPKDMNKDIYFYYKFGNIYGKGVMDGMTCSASGRIRIGIEIFQNIETDPAPKVRRNLRTR
jgi:hypothetical protein